MKILLAHKFNYQKGGAERYFLDLARLLEKNGIETAKFSMASEKNLPDRYEKYFIPEIDFNAGFFQLSRSFFRYLGRIFYSFEAAGQFEKLIRDFRPDIVHLQNIYHQISPSIIDTAKKHGLPVIMHLHDYKLICPNYKLYDGRRLCMKCKGGKYYQCALNRCLKGSYLKSFLASLEMYFHHKVLKIYDKVDLFIAPSAYMKSVCVDFGIREDRIAVVPNFVEPAEFPEGGRKDYVLFLGRLSEEKGLSVLIDAYREPDGKPKLKIVGDGPEAEKCREETAASGLEERIEFTGALYGEALGQAIAGAKALIVPSVWPENLPYVVLEAFQAGKPVIASKLGGLEEMIRDGQNGFLFEPGNPRELSRAIARLASCDPERLSSQARQAAEDYSSLKHLESIKNIYGRFSK